MAEGAASLAQEVQEQTERDCETWQKVIAAQDDFVAALLRKRSELQQRLAEAQQNAVSVNSEVTAKFEEEGRVARLAHLEAEVARARETYQERLRTQEEAEKTLANLDTQLAQLELQATGRQLESPRIDVRIKADRSPPFVLAFINGTVAPFSDALIQKGTTGGREASSLLRGQIELDLSALSTEGEAAAICFVYYDSSQLVPSLERNHVVSTPAMWRNFLDGFSRVTGNFVVDVSSSTPAEEHIAAVLSKFGFMPNLQQVYLVGVHPEQGLAELVGGLPDSGARLADRFLEQVMPKVNLVQHLPRDGMGDLADATIEFAGLFESSIALPISFRQGNGQSSRTTVPPSTPRGSVAGGSTSGPPRARSTASTSTTTRAQPAASPRAEGKVEINPQRGLLHQEPPLCFQHYLSLRGCPWLDCQHSHDYVLTEDQMYRLREEVATYPCAGLRQTGKCTHAQRYNEICMFSHDLKGRRAR